MKALLITGCGASQMIDTTGKFTRIWRMRVRFPTKEEYWKVDSPPAPKEVVEKSRNFEFCKEDYIDDVKILVYREIP